MTQKIIPLTLRVLDYAPSLIQHLESGLARDMTGPRPHALSCVIQSGRHPRLVDFSAWRRQGQGSHASNGISAEADDVRDALSVAAFQIGDSGGYLGALPRDAFSQPAYLFMTHATIAWDRSLVGRGPMSPIALEQLCRRLTVAQTRGASTHAALRASKQIQAALQCLFQLETGSPVHFRTMPQAV